MSFERHDLAKFALRKHLKFAFAKQIPGVLDDGGLDFVDELYDTTASAFLIGTIDYEFLGDGIATLQHSGIVVNQGYDISGELGFNALTFSSVPEPTTMGIFSLGLFFLAKRRRK